jgi:hypothetical protein
MADESFTLGPPTQEAMFIGPCPMCSGEIVEGELIYFDESYGLWICLGCADA